MNNILITTTAIKILIIGGVLNLVFGFIIGHLLGLYRLKNPEMNYKYLLSAHKAGLQQGFMLLGLVFAVILSQLSNYIEAVASILLISSTILLNLGEVINWLNNIEDEFKSKPTGFIVKLISAVLSTAGLGILTYGILISI